MIHTPDIRIRSALLPWEPVAGTRTGARSIAVTIMRGVAHLVMLPWRVWRIRGVLATLADLSDRELGDIGLARQDLRDAVALPPGCSPTPLLASRVEGRRRAGHLKRV